MKKQKKKRMGYAPRIKKVHFQKMNRNYKDTLFCMLFRDKQRLLSLYNAVNHSDYNNPDELQVVTLENAIYMNMKNDIAFLIHDELHLYEHQSTGIPICRCGIFFTWQENIRSWLTAEHCMAESCH